MSFDVSRISDPLFFAENRLPARSDHRWYRDAEEAEQQVSGYETVLNGVWKFHYAPNLSASIPGFEGRDFNSDSWDSIPVPAHIQMQGYDRPQYVNSQYPWDGHEEIMPGQIPQKFNPVASYITTFDWDEPLAAGEQLSVMFHGAESAIALWLNGEYIGYACDSFTPLEFDLSPALVVGENKLAAQVFKWTAASWLEDQDFFRFSGIFRDVVLYHRPAVHVEDVRIATTVNDDFNQAQLTVEPKLRGEGSITATLVGVGPLQAEDGTFTITINEPRLWSAEDPYLYQLVIEVHDQSGNLVEHIPQQVGVRRFEIADGLLKINGERIVFKGVNRHDFGLQGRVITRAQTEADIIAIKQLGINAVRTSHYPNNHYFYDLCDEYGLYVIDEMNLETHGMWNWLKYSGAGDEEAFPGDKPQWLPSLLDRAASMFERDKNHPSIVMWSIGNESYGGKNLLEVSDYFRSHDSRPVHYEGVHWDPRYPQTTDVVSQMYTPAAEVEEFLRTNRDKPFILCEYAHAMGNSFGAVEKYTELAYREPLYQGGFIWDFADQAIQMRDRYGTEFFGYGGDNGEAPHDGDFCGNGIFFADRTPKPFAQEVKYHYQGFHTLIGRESITIHNRFLFTSTDKYECIVKLSAEGETRQRHTLHTAVPPGQSATYDLPFAIPENPGEYSVDVSFHLREETRWAPAGFEIGWEQKTFQVGQKPKVAAPSKKPEVVVGTDNVGVHGKHFTMLFSRLTGGLQSYKFGATPASGKELLKAIPMPNFWHAPTSNERGWNAPFTDGQWLLASRYAKAHRGPAHPLVQELNDSVLVTQRYTLPTTPLSESEVAFRIFGDGRVEVTVVVRPGEGLPDMPEFGMLFTADAELRNLRIFGHGPQENYVDRSRGARLGIYTADVADQLAPYLRPQESGSRTGVRWATITNDRGIGLRFEHDHQMEFSALPWTPFEIENATHHTELPPIQHTILRPALMRRGVGGDDTWGAQTHPEFRLPRGGELSFTFSFQGVHEMN